MIVYEPELKENEFFHSGIIRDLEAFKQEADVIVANRRNPTRPPTRCDGGYGVDKSEKVVIVIIKAKGFA